MAMLNNHFYLSNINLTVQSSINSDDSIYEDSHLHTYTNKNIDEDDSLSQNRFLPSQFSIQQIEDWKRLKSNYFKEK